MVNGAGSVAEILCSLELLTVRPQQLLGTAEDITERKAKRVRTRTAIGAGAGSTPQLRQPTGLKMTFINGFARVAQPLSAIIGYTQLLHTPKLKRLRLPVRLKPLSAAPSCRLN